MIFPLGHDRLRARRWPWLTLGLIAVNFVVHVVVSRHDAAAVEAYAKAGRAAAAYWEQHPDTVAPPALRDFLAQSGVSDRRASSGRQVHRLMRSPVQRVADELAEAGAPVARDALASQTAAEQAELDALAAPLPELARDFVALEWGWVPARGGSLSLVTSQFLHGGWLHLLGNMWFLFLAGPLIEDAWGIAIFVAFYVASGLVAAVCHSIAASGSHVPMIGASGAIAGLLGAFLVKEGRANIKLLWFFGFRPRVSTAPAWLMLPLWFVSQLVWGLVVPSDHGGVAYWAHVGGFVFGVAVALALRHGGVEARIAAWLGHEPWDDDAPAQVILAPRPAPAPVPAALAPSGSWVAARPASVPPPAGLAHSAAAPAPVLPLGPAPVLPLGPAPGALPLATELPDLSTALPERTPLPVVPAALPSELPPAVVHAALPHATSLPEPPASPPAAAPARARSAPSPGGRDAARSSLARLERTAREESGDPAALAALVHAAREAGDAERERRASLALVALHLRTGAPDAAIAAWDELAARGLEGEVAPPLQLRIAQTLERTGRLDRAEGAYARLHRGAGRDAVAFDALLAHAELALRRDRAEEATWLFLAAKAAPWPHPESEGAIERGLRACDARARDPGIRLDDGGRR